MGSVHIAVSEIRRAFDERLRREKPLNILDKLHVTYYFRDLRIDLT